MSAFASSAVESSVMDASLVCLIIPCRRDSSTSTYFRRSIAHPEASPAGGDDPVDIALIAPAEHNCSDAKLVVRDDVEVCADISVLGEHALDGRPGTVGR